MVAGSMKTPAFVAVIASLLLAGISVSVQASSIPSFPSCLDPSGTISAQYDSGTHGIVGDAGVYTGSDKVYTIDGAKTLQCFCADNGNGIQTLWLNTSVFGQDVISDLVSAGAGIPMLPPTGSAHTELAISALIALAILLVWKLRRKTT